VIDSIWKVGGGILAVALITGGVLMTTTDAPNPEVISDNMLAKAYMDKNKSKYATCYNSIKNAEIEFFKVGIEDYPDLPAERTEQLEAQFIKDVKTKCSKPIKDYESSYATYKSTELEIAKFSQSILDKLLGIDHYSQISEVDQYKPSTVRLLTNGNPFTDTIYTKEDITRYFEKV